MSGDEGPIYGNDIKVVRVFKKEECVARRPVEQNNHGWNYIHHDMRDNMGEWTGVYRSRYAYESDFDDYYYNEFEFIEDEE